MYRVGSRIATTRNLKSANGGAPLPVGSTGIVASSYKNGVFVEFDARTDPVFVLYNSVRPSMADPDPESRFAPAKYEDWDSSHVG